MSEAGCPAVADPGASLVAAAHFEGYRVKPLVGPSSILLALMASGLSGQHFCFHGYLPIKPIERKACLHKIEMESRQNRSTQIFIETPYRNEALFSALLDNCADTTYLVVACDLTLPSEQITSKTILAWKKTPVPNINKRPAIFLLLAQ